MASSRSQSGQSVVEVLIAVAILGLMTTASFVLLATSFSESLFAENRAQAEHVLSEGLAAVRQMRDRDFDLLTSGSHGLTLGGSDWVFNSTEDITDGLYHRSVSITEVDDDQRDITVTVTWEPRPGRSVSLETTTRLTNWAGVEPELPPASNCEDASAISGDWTSPIVLGSGDIGPGNQGTDVVVKLPYAYISGVAASSSKPDIFVFNVSNPASPSLVKSIDIGANGISTLFVDGNYLYAASGNDTKEVIIFDISTPANMSVATTIDLTGTADAKTILIKDDLLVIGREDSANSEIYFYNIATPTSPTFISAFNVAEDVNDFTASNTYLYAVNSASVSDVQIFDITNPLAPSLAATYTLDDSADDVSVAYQNPGTLFIGNAANKFIILDVSDLQHITQQSSTSVVSGEVKDTACVAGDLAFLGTTDSNKEFVILDISDLENIVQYATMNFPQVTGGVVFLDNTVYVAVRSNDSLRIIGPSP